MSFWLAIVIIVAIGAVSEMYRARVKSATKGAEEMGRDISARMAKIEERMANLETIVLEQEKGRPFGSLDG